MKEQLVCLLLAFLSFSCSRPDAIRIMGSTTVLPPVSKAGEAFRKKHPNINITVNAGGSGVGINQLGEKKADIGMTSRQLTAAEKKKYADLDLNPIPIGKDAVIPVVSSEIYEAGIQELSLSQIGKIYKGKIRNWKTVGGPDKEILCIDKEASRGTRHVFMKEVLGNVNAKAPGADLVLGSNNEEQTAIVQSDAAIGMLSIAWLNEEVKGLSIIKDSTEIDPTLQNIRSGKFPISRKLFVITRGRPQGKTKDFIDFLLSKEGQTLVRSSGYVSIKQ